MEGKKEIKNIVRAVKLWAALLRIHVPTRSLATELGIAHLYGIPLRSFLAFVFPLCKTMNLEQFYFTDAQIVQSTNAQLQLSGLAFNSIRQMASDEFQNNENLLVTIPQSSTEKFNGRHCCSLSAVEDLSLVRYTTEITEFNPITSSLQRFPRRLSAKV